MFYSNCSGWWSSMFLPKCFQILSINYKSEICAVFFFLSLRITNACSYLLINWFQIEIALKKPVVKFICLYLLLITLMNSIINNKLRQKISIWALLKQFKFKINLSRNNYENLWWLNSERQKEVNIKGICSFVKDFGNF